VGGRASDSGCARRIMRLIGSWGRGSLTVGSMRSGGGLGGLTGGAIRLGYVRGGYRGCR